MALRFPVRALVRSLSSCLLLLAFSACSGGDGGGPTSPSDPSTENFASALGVNLSQMTERQPRLFVQDLVVGTGAEATNGRSLSVRYTGWLRSGVQFDGNAPSGTPFVFTLGVGQVIPGWDLGVAGMRVGGKRRLVFGSEYGYGARGSGSIPAHATLIFDVDLISATN